MEKMRIVLVFRINDLFKYITTSSNDQIKCIITSSREKGRGWLIFPDQSKAMSGVMAPIAACSAGNNLSMHKGTRRIIHYDPVGLQFMFGLVMAFLICYREFSRQREYSGLTRYCLVFSSTQSKSVIRCPAQKKKKL